jgi:hypothetical protein
MSMCTNENKQIANSKIHNSIKIVVSEFDRFHKCTNTKKNSPLKSSHYPISDTTSVTSGTIRLSMPSIPDLSVTVDEGHPLHDP